MDHHINIDRSRSVVMVNTTLWTIHINIDWSRSVVMVNTTLWTIHIRCSNTGTARQVTVVPGRELLYRRHRCSIKELPNPTARLCSMMEFTEPCACIVESIYHILTKFRQNHYTNIVIKCLQVSIIQIIPNKNNSETSFIILTIPSRILVH